MAGRTILIADDDWELAPILALHLRNEEYDVAYTCEGSEALDLARQRRPDLLLLDSTLPTGDGRTVHEHLVVARDLATLPLIFLREQRNERRGEAPAIPDAASIRKPVATSELLRKVKAALDPV
ncbi:MAG: response regulator transcription factor [Acidimicrobiia bacterium]